MNNSGLWEIQDGNLAIPAEIVGIHAVRDTAILPPKDTFNSNI